jgi:hypothetical protein
VKKSCKPSSTESPLFLSIDPEPIPETLTAMGGVPLLVQAFRSLGVPARVREQVKVKQRERGLDEAEMVESFVVLNAMGGVSCACTKTRAWVRCWGTEFPRRMRRRGFSISFTKRAR